MQFYLIQVVSELAAGVSSFLRLRVSTLVYLPTKLILLKVVLDINTSYINCQGYCEKAYPTGG